MSSEILYYNLTIRGDTETNIGSVPAAILAQNSYPIVNDPSQYFFSIIRMSVNMFNVPISYFYPYVDANGNVPNVNNGALAFTLVYGTNQITQNLTWISNNGNPAPANGLPYKGNPYWFIYDYSTYITIWNNALLSAYNALSALVGGGTLPLGQQPFFNYNSSTSLLELYGVQSLCEPSSGNYLQIYGNEQVAPYVKGFRYQFINDPLKVKSVFFNVQSLPNSTTSLNQVMIGSTNYIKMVQDFNGMCFWNYLESVNVLTNIPSIQEGYYVGNGNSASSISKLSNNLIFQTSLTDFLPDLSQGSGSNGVASGIFVYNAPSLFRLIQFVNNSTPLDTIDANIHFGAKDGSDYPLTIFSNQVCTLKFMFIKKYLISSILSRNTKGIF